MIAVDIKLIQKMPDGGSSGMERVRRVFDEDDNQH